MSADEPVSLPSVNDEPGYGGSVQLRPPRLSGTVWGPGGKTITIRVTDESGSRVLWSGRCGRSRTLPGGQVREVGFEVILGGGVLRRCRAVRLFDAASGVELPVSPVVVPDGTSAWLDRLARMLHLPFLHVTALGGRGGRITCRVSVAGDFPPHALPPLEVMNAAGEWALTAEEIGAPLMEGRRRAAFAAAPSFPSCLYALDLSAAFLAPLEDEAGTPFVILRIRRDGAVRPLSDERTVGRVPVHAVAIPPAADTRGGPGTVRQQFTTLAFAHARAFRTAYEAHADRPFTEIGAVLDLGCGHGRLAQQLVGILGGARVRGADVDRAAVAWCRLNLKGGTFAVADPEPPLPYPDDSFDLVVSTSIFGELSLGMIRPWLKEVNRVLRPGGIAAVAVPGETQVAFERSSDGRLKALAERGIVTHVRNDPSGEPVRSVRMTADFTRQAFGAELDLLAVYAHALGAQDLVVARAHA
jgi:SAM-dependent methyltransferase